MGKKNNKKSKSEIDWKTLIISAILDLLIGIILIIIEKMT